jgi:hypothetical protein
MVGLARADTRARRDLDRLGRSLRADVDANESRLIALVIAPERFSMALMAIETAFGGSHFVRQRSNHSLGLRPTLASLAPEGRSRGLP